jgi:DNA mismatch repair protein MutS
MAQVTKNQPSDTPAMRQYRRFKEEHPQCVLFFRMGDFYEMFFEDAKLAHKVLGVTLTQRTEGVPMAGVPYHAVENYLRRMIQAGYRVAVCDQLEDPALAKGVVERGVTRVITPGTLTDEHLLDEGAENPLAAVMWPTAPPRGSGFEVQGSGMHTDPQSHIPHPTTHIDSQSAATVALAWAELSTGAFHVALLQESQVGDELARISPRELLFCETADGQTPPRIKALAAGLQLTPLGRPAWPFRSGEAAELLKRQFQVTTLAGFGFQDDDPVLGPAAAVVHYLLETQCPESGSGARGSGIGDWEASRPVPGRGSAAEMAPGTSPGAAPGAGAVPGAGRRLAHLSPPRRFVRSAHLVIDAVSLRALEVDRTLRRASEEGSLLSIFRGECGCVTAMGKRLLRHWLCYPLGDLAAIQARQRVVGELLADGQLQRSLRTALDQVHDVQRIVGRLAVGRATPRDVVALGRSAAQVRSLVELLAQRPAVQEQHAALAELVGPIEELGRRIAAACIDSPPAHLREGGLFRDGYDGDLDECRLLQRDSHSWLAAYQKSLIDETGITALKVGFNKVFGYYIEVTAAHQTKLEDRMNGGGCSGWSRKQTLKNAERYITPPLKEFEGKVLSAQTRAVAREQVLFEELGQAAAARVPQLQRFAAVAAELDVLSAFALRAGKHAYVRPELTAEPVLDIAGGRHPVLDELLGDRFVPNDVTLGNAKADGGRRKVEGTDDQESAAGHHPSQPSSSTTLALITGPNMAGKSTYIRQTALLTLLAHTGSYVPADRATVGLCDRIFTRIGASDELHTGQSTFMVEMTETANICHHATPGSLVILDEIGRGTSTLDGLSLAWAITEHLAGRGCRTLFATHYHELTELADRFANVANLHVTVREWQDEVVFLHRIAAGKTDRSYGIHVAKIAGLPPDVVHRAADLLGALEVNHQSTSAPGSTHGSAGLPAVAPPRRSDQLALFTEYVEHPVVQALRDLDLTRLSPLEAFDALRRLRAAVDGPTPPW